MVKRREVKKSTIDEQIEKFADGAEKRVVVIPELNPDAKRDYKAIQLPFNQYEFEKLEMACKRTGRSKLNFVRTAMLKLASEVE